MSRISEHCPFLNRADSGCGQNFRLDGLQHAFQYCFDRYNACPRYHELLLHRRQNRANAQVELTVYARDRFIQLGLQSRHSPRAHAEQARIG